MPPKKDKPKEKPPGWNLDFTEGTLVLIFALAIVSSVVPSLIKYITSGEISFFGFKLSFIFDFFKSNIQFFKSLGFIIAGLAALASFVLTKKGDHILREEKAKLYPADMPKEVPAGESAQNKQKEKWEKIVKLSESQNSSEWRLAIIEADIILDELLINLHLPGETMGERLKAVEKSDFTTIEFAWEAHKARNAIAHQGGDFLLNQRETRRIISLYEAVFKEFHLI